uniref:Conotoxin n=1 Tax=Conus praecellens TaxID=128530 RepID=A0A291C2L2_CONPC|nr:conotoxin [Conus praecellens]
MRLTWVLIIAILFLTACQLITADYSRDKHQYRAMKSRDGMRKPRPFGSYRCGSKGRQCLTIPCCRGLSCRGYKCK